MRWEYVQTDGPAPPGDRWEKHGRPVPPAVVRWRRVDRDWAAALALDYMKAPPEAIRARNNLPLEVIPGILKLLSVVVAPPPEFARGVQDFFEQRGGIRRIAPAVREYIDQVLRRQRLLLAVAESRFTHLGVQR